MAENRVERVLNFKDISGHNIRFANFAGREVPPFNPAGKRNFCVDILDPGFAEELAREGWNIRYDKNEQRIDEGAAFPPNLKIEIGFNDKVPHPRIMMEQAGNKVWLNEETLGDLDEMEIIRIVEMEIRPYNWNVRGETGVSAYLSKMRVEVARDMFCD